MAFALGCPILGDHKYSHWTKLAPQVKHVRTMGSRAIQMPDPVISLISCFMNTRNFALSLISLPSTGDNLVLNLNFSRG